MAVTCILDSWTAGGVCVLLTRAVRGLHPIMSDIFFPVSFFLFVAFLGANTFGDAGCKLVVLEWSMRIPFIACVCVCVCVLRSSFLRM
jgi:hypothetical protein